jgi:hypothetical protein
MKAKYVLKSLFILTGCLALFAGCEEDLGEGVNLKDIQVGDNLRVNIGETARAQAWPVPWDCTNYEFNWESADINIASVDNYGRVLGEDVGNTTIYVSEGNIKKEIPVEIYEVTLQEKLEAISGLAGFWQFADGSNLEKATVGKDFVTYLRAENNILGSPSTEGISQVAGYNKRDYAVQIGHQSLFYADHGLSATAGSELVKEYTILWDINRPSGEGGYGTLLNTSITNSNDQDYAIKSDGRVGVGTCGYSTEKMVRDTWYRVVICLKAGEYLRIYVNGIKWLEGNNSADDRFGLDPAGTLIMGDNDGDDHTMYLSSVAIYDRALSEDEIKSLGGL